MRVLITGIGGFVGKHLTKHLLSTTDKLELHGTVYSSSQPGVDEVAIHQIDLRDQTAVEKLIGDIQPQRIYHLAAQAAVHQSFAEPWQTLENNIKSQLNIFEGCRKHNIFTPILVISSAEVYGPVKPDEVPLNENAPLRPTSPYGVSKIAQDMLALQYHMTYNWSIMRARAFNHIGTGQSTKFVAPAFAMQIARIEAGLQDPELKVGDLTALRDFTDVRDVVRAYSLILDTGEPGAVYNIASGRTVSIQYLLDTLINYSTRQDIKVTIDQSRLRPSSTPILQGDFKRLKEATGWQPQYNFEDTLHTILDDCRQRVQNNEE